MRRTRALLGVVAASAMVGSFLYGCGGGSDVEIAGATSSSSGAGQGGAGGSGSSGTAGSSAGGNGAGGNAAGTGGGGSAPSECATAKDCDTLHGAAPCGAWACNAGSCEAQSPGCTDADQDGYGSGAACACAGLDCDDNDDTIGGSGARKCYSGPAGTDGVGTCRAGLETCSAGAWSACVGEITPSGEACNGQDDDCNNAVDDNLGTFNCGIGACANKVNACTNGVVGTCTPGAPGGASDGPLCDGIDTDCDGAIDEDCNVCVKVSPNGNDATANGSALLPFKTVQAAINHAVATNETTVCVAAGAACGATGTYASAAGETVTMANGVSVLGNYESTLWSRCALNSNTVTVLQPKTPEGVTFPNTVVKTTVLDGFRVDRFNSPTTAGVTVDGAKSAIISFVTVNNAPGVMNSYGVDVKNGGEVTITKDRIEAGTGSTESIGVRSVGSKVTIDNNCLSLDAVGHCDDGCGGANSAIRGRVNAGPGVTYGVLLQDSPGSLIQGSAICGNAADQGATVRIAGDGAGIQIRANNLVAFGGAQHSHGIWAEECGGAAPWIVDNHLIISGGTTINTVVDGVRAIGDCHPVIDSNERISGGGEGNTSNTTGVHCGANANMVASQCVVLGNKLIQGSQFGFPPSATGVRCDNGGCMRVANNVITGRGGVDSYGITIETTGTVVDNNLVRGGCSSNSATGILATDVFSRVQNNRVFGFSQIDCSGAGGAAVKQSTGMRAIIAPGANEIDVHSNDFIGGDSMGQCVSVGVALDVGLVKPAGGVGIFRNNIFLSGVCATTRLGFSELTDGADPRVFENNNFDPAGAPTALYMDEAASPLVTAMAIDGLVDMTVKGTLSGSSLFMAFPTDLHIQSGSVCEGAGTPVGAPAVDMDGAPRDPATPDIGADER